MVSATWAWISCRLLCHSETPYTTMTRQVWGFSILSYPSISYWQWMGTCQQCQPIKKKNYRDVKLILTQSYLVISMKASVNVIFDGGTLTLASVITCVLGWKKALNPLIATRVLHLKNKKHVFLYLFPSVRAHTLFFILQHFFPDDPHLFIPGNHFPGVFSQRCFT